MKFNVKTPVKNYLGKIVQSTDEQTGEQKDFTFRELIDRALNMPLKDEIPTGEVRSKVHQINLKLYASKDVELTSKEVAFILERATKSQYITNPFYGFLEDFLEKKDVFYMKENQDEGVEIATESKTESASDELTSPNVSEEEERVGEE